MKKGRQNLNRLLAAAVTAALLSSCAAAPKASDVFKGIFREKSSTGEYVPLDKMKRLVDSTGKSLGQEESHEGITIRLEGMAADSLFLTLALEVEVADDSSLLKKFAPGEVGNPELQKVELRIQDVPEYSFLEHGLSDYITHGYLKRIDDQGDSSRARLICSLELPGSGVRGRQATLTLGELQGEFALPSEDIAFAYQDLAELYGSFSPVAETEFILPDVYLPDTGERHPFSPDYPHTSVVNAGFYQGAFHLALVCEDQEEYERLNKQSLGFRREGWASEAGDIPIAYFHVPGDGRTLEDPSVPAYLDPPEGSGYYYYTCGEIKDVSMLEGLKPYFVAGRYPKEISESSWNFTFPLDFAETTVERTVDFTSEWDGDPLRVTGLTWSPLSYSVTGTYGSPGREFEPADRDMRVSFRMRDGGEIALTNQHFKGEQEDGEAPKIQLIGMLPYVINPEDVTALILGDQEFPLA